MKIKENIQVPFDKHGNLAHYPEYGTEMREGLPFHGELTLVGVRRGRSAAYFMWTDSKGKRFPMFLSEMESLLLASSVIQGKASGSWGFCKKGCNYSIKPLLENKNND